MGQQQLLLLVLSTVIVGLATVAGIQAFEQGSTQANQDALTNTAVKIASDVQARIKEPSQFGGYDDNLSDATSNITLEEMGYDTNSGVYETADGNCAITTGGSGGTGDVDEASEASGDIIVSCESEPTNDSEGNVVSAGVTGTDSDDITSYQEVKSGS